MPLNLITVVHIVGQVFVVVVVDLMNLLLLSFGGFRLDQVELERVEISMDHSYSDGHGYR